MISLRNLIFISSMLIILTSGIASGYGAHKPGIEEKLGHTVPRGLTFFNEKGNKVFLNSLTDRPAIVSLVYLSCSRTCPLLLGSLAEALEKADFKQGLYRVITVSFDDKDTPAQAAEKKRNYTKAVRESFSEESWIFLTGNRENINKFTEAAGFEFRREEGGFSHPAALIFLSPGGRIVRYLYGLEYSPFDIKMALAEAASENGLFSAGRLALFCFSYDPSEKRYTFNTIKVSGAVASILSASLLVFIALTLKNRRKRDDGR